MSVSRGDPVREMQSEGQSQRPNALSRDGSFYSGSEQDFSAITSLVCSVLQVSTCAVTLNDNTLEWLQWSKELGKIRASVDSSCPKIGDRERVPQIDDEEVARSSAGPPPVVGHVAVPLVGPDAVQLGMLCVIDNKPFSFDTEKQKILNNFACLIVEQINLRAQAQHDFLTGALTRRAFVSACDSAVRQYRRDGVSSALLVFDLDNFKLINDTHGHVTGDQVLKAVADVCANSLRPGDLLGRLGGEEFGIILPHTEYSAAKLCVERVRKLIEQLTLPCGSVTASFGLAMVEDQPEFKKWFSAADCALYKAKRGGRNCWATDRTESHLIAEVSPPRSFVSALKIGLRNRRTVGNGKQSLPPRVPRPPFALFARA